MLPMLQTVIDAYDAGVRKAPAKAAAEEANIYTRFDLRRCRDTVPLFIYAKPSYA
jgi:hypothetical protein